MAKKKRCYTYLRVSTEKQVDGYSIDAQRKNVQKLADLKDFEIVREYVDAGFSGADIQNRPAFTQMMKDIENDKDGIQYVLSFKLSRMGRNAIDTLESLRKMQSHGVNILTDDGAVDSSSAYGNFFILIMSGLAEMERENILAQTFSGRVEKARQGRYNGGQAPYGYRIRHSDNKKENGLLEINEEEAPLVRLIFDRYVNHEKGDGKVADYLMSHGYTKAVRENGKLQYIDESFVGHVVRNEVYCGVMVYGKRTNVKNPKNGKISTRTKDKSEWYRSEGLHEPIISKELFAKAQEIRSRNTHNQPKVRDINHASIFSGILVCPYCGAPMHGIGATPRKKVDGTDGKAQYYYTCSNHRRKRGEFRCPNAKGVRQERIDSIMADIIVYVANDENFRKDINSRIGKAIDTREYESQIEKLSSQIRNKNKTLKRKTLAIDDFDWDVDNADAVYDALNDDYMKLHNEIATLERSLSEVEDALEGVKKKQLTQDNVYKFILEFGRIYNNLPEIKKKELVNTFIEKVEIFPEEKEDGSIIKSVTFKFPLAGFERKVETSDINSLTTGKHVETCVLLVKETCQDDDMVSIKVDMEGINFKQNKQIDADKPTYDNIKRWVNDKYGFKVSNLYIAQVKDRIGMKKRENYNIGEGKGFVPICPPEKEVAIMDAFRHFGVI